MNSNNPYNQMNEDGDKKLRSIELWCNQDMTECHDNDLNKENDSSETTEQGYIKARWYTHTIQIRCWWRLTMTLIINFVCRRFDTEDEKSLSQTLASKLLNMSKERFCTLHSELSRHRLNQLDFFTHCPYISKMKRIKTLV